MTGAEQCPPPPLGWEPGSGSGSGTLKLKYYDLQTTGWCFSSLDDLLNYSVFSAEECWAACRAQHKDLVAADWNWTGTQECYCQNDCLCMEDVGSSGELVTTNDTVLPAPCNHSETEDAVSPTTSWPPANAKSCFSDADCKFEGCANRPCNSSDRPDLESACITGFWDESHDGVWEHRCMGGYCYHAYDCVPHGCGSGHSYQMCNTSLSGSAPRMSDWGKAEHDHCFQPYSWRQIIQGSEDLAKTGGLGKLMEVDGYETWQCICDHSCAWEFSTDPQDSWFCFVYHETNAVFTPWGPNSLLKLVAPSPCWTNRTNSSAGGHAETFANFGAVLDHMLDHW